jgi:hypothetical protein
MIMRQGKQYVLFAGLLDEAHNRGLRGIDTELIQVPTAENGNVAVVKAVVNMEAAEGSEGSRTFSGIGDASPDNVGRNIVPHIIRMAETRAKARALRDAVNVGATALEELSDSDEGAAAPAASYPPPRGLQGAGKAAASQPARPRAVEDSEEPATNGSTEAPRETSQETSSQGSSQRGAGGSSQKARKSQIDLLRTLAEELRGESGVARLESRIGKPLGELSRTEADEWIDRLTPAEGRE